MPGKHDTDQKPVRIRSRFDELPKGANEAKQSKAKKRTRRKASEHKGAKKSRAIGKNELISRASRVDEQRCKRRTAALARHRSLMVGCSAAGTES